MSGLIFPSSLLGQQFTPRKTPNFNTKPQKALSGKESRISYRAYPLYEWELSYEFLSDEFQLSLPRTNFIAFSQDFTQWTAQHAGAGFAPIVLGSWVGQPAPDGTYTADRLILNVGTGSSGGDYSQIYVPLTQLALPNYSGLKTFTFSVWLATNDGSTTSVIVNIGSNVQTLTVTPNWQRFVISSPGITTSELPTIGVYGSSGSKYADLSAWGAQLEYGTVATSYIVTNGAGVRVSDLKSMFGMFSQMLGQYDTFLYQDPDFNSVTLQPFAVGNGSSTTFNLTATYQPGAEIAQFLYGLTNQPPVVGPAGAPEWIQNTIGAPVLYTGRYNGPEMLSTGSRTNLALQCNFAGDLDDHGGLDRDQLLAAPDGTTTAAKFTESTSASVYAVELAQSGILTANTRYTFSVWLKYGSRQFVMLSLDDDSANGNVFCFDLVNGVVSAPFHQGTAYSSAADATMTPFPNGWWRCSISGQFASVTARISIVHTTSFAGAWYPSFTGTSAFTYMWGAQLELGTTETALIPVTTTHATNGGSDYSLTTFTEAGTSVWTFLQVQMSAAPANTVQLLWTGSFFYRCRFSDDRQDFAKTHDQLWELKKLQFEQILL